MKISEFREWAEGKGAINPLVEDETISSKEAPWEPERTDRKIHTYVFPAGRIIEVFCDEEDTIVRIRGDGEIGLVM